MARGDDLDKIVGPLEAEILRTLWAARRAMTVRDVLARLNDGRQQALAYTTVMTVMARLADKGILSRRAEGRGYVYEARAKDAAEIAVRNVVRDFGDAAVTHFLDEARADPKLMRQLERLMRGKR